MVDAFRFPPSPSGSLHLGGARTAYVNWLAAKSSNGKFVFRVDNTDLERSKQEYIDTLLESMDWLKLDYDEIHYQSKRTTIYLEQAELLLKENLAIRLENNAIALNSKNIPEVFTDEISGDIKITDTNREQISKVILVRGGDKLGQPTYQFCSVVDDYLLGITHIIRGVDHLSNTPKQLVIWNCLDQIHGLKRQVKFSHIGLLMKDGKKLSKRDNAANILWYREQGYKSEAVLDFVLRMGWSLKVPMSAGKEGQKKANEPLSQQEAIKVFQQGALKNSPCNFSMDKLEWLNKRY